MGQFCINQKHASFFCARKQVTGALFLIWKRSEPFLEKLFSELKKPIKLYRYVENVPCRRRNQYNQPRECLQKCSQMCGFTEQNDDVAKYFYDLSSMLLSKFFNNCLTEISLIMTTSRAKVQVILSEMYCTENR